MCTPFGPAFPTLRKETRICIGINIKLFFKTVKDYLLGVDYECFHSFCILVS